MRRGNLYQVGHLGVVSATALLALAMPSALAAQSTTLSRGRLSAPAAARTLDTRMRGELLTTQQDTSGVSPASPLLDAHVPMLTSQEVGVQATVQQPAASAQSAAVEQAQIRVSPERIREIAPGIGARSSVPIITAEGMDSVPVVAGGIQLRRGEFAVFRTDDTRQVAEPAAPPVAAGAAADPASGLPFHVLPFRFVTPDATLTGEWVLRPIYQVANRLRWEPDSGQFEGLLYLAVEDTTRRRESRPLPVPIRFELVSDAESLDPTTFAVEHTNLPLQRVHVLTRFAMDSVRVHIVPEFDIAGVDIWMPVAPSLTLEAPHQIQGWGIETARVLVRVIGTTNVRPTTLSLSTTAGALDSTRIAIDASGSASTGIRSAGLGGARIDAGGPGFPAASVYVDFVFPWVFLLAAILGGIFGGLGAAMQNNNVGSPPKWSWSAIKGLFAGVLAALAWYALGISLFQFHLDVARFNELAVFTLAALAAYFGIPKPKHESEQPTTARSG